VATSLQWHAINCWIDVIGELARAITFVWASGVSSSFEGIGCLIPTVLACAFQIGICFKTSAQPTSCNVALVKFGASVAHCILLVPQIFLVLVDENSPFHKKPFETLLGIVMWLTMETKPNIAPPRGWRDDLWFLLARAAMPALADSTESNEETRIKQPKLIWGCSKALVNIIYLVVVCVLGIEYCNLETTSAENKLWTSFYMGLTFLLFGGSVVAMLVAELHLYSIRNSGSQYALVSGEQEMSKQQI